MDWLDRLRSIKAQSKLTTKDISYKSGIPEPTLEKLFSGKTKDPKLNTMIQLMHSLGHTLDDIAPAKEIGAVQQASPTLTPESIKIAHAYEGAGEGIKEGVRKMLDVEPDAPAFKGQDLPPAKMA